MSIWMGVVVYEASLFLVIVILALNDIAFVQLGYRRVHPGQLSFLGLSWDSTRQVFLLVLLPFAVVTYGQVVGMMGVHFDVALSSFFVMAGGFEPTMYFLISGLTELEKPEKQDRLVKLDAIPEGFITIRWWHARFLTVLAFGLTGPLIYLGLANPIGTAWLSLACLISFFGVGLLLSNLRRRLNTAEVTSLVSVTAIALVYTFYRFLTDLMIGM